MANDQPASLASPPPEGQTAAIAGVLASMVIFAGNYVASRHGLNQGLGPVDLLAARYLVCGPLLAVAFLRVRMPRLSRAVILTVLGGAPYFGVILFALRFAPASHAVVLNPGCTIVSVFAFSAIILRRRPSLAALIGVVIILVGLVAIAWDGLLKPGHAVWFGDLLLAASGVQWGLFMTLLQRWRVPGLVATATVSVLSLPPVLLLVAIAGLPLGRAPPLEIAGQTIFQGVLVGAIGFVLFNQSVARLGAAMTAFFPPLVPVLGTLMSAAWLGESVSAVQLGGIVTVIAGMVGGAVLGRARRVSAASRVSADTAPAGSRAPAP